ncbi:MULTISPECIES: hypothetical protein [unclassified Prochlorococcus]|uniref:hypothetical protein n=1 Tax=unclassified Prochlorococcus TaxID=2627481 RepID=UPI000533AA9B|nr:MULTISPECIES: hypothetical protein [unclassified Prochlorococcus]KGG15236.1 hypothetical protein EV06_1106 [Prochlorococcus sp. MIT 0602]KGG17512.1 hypothetical protein EV07_0952 [Prochlorococcus sp. MIT 0603]
MKIIKSIIICIALLVIDQYPTTALTRRDIKSICVRTSNYQKCIREFTENKEASKSKQDSIRKGPIPIKVIPYK